MAVTSQFYLVADAEQLLAHSTDIVAACQTLKAAAILIMSDDFSKLPTPALIKQISNLQNKSIAVLIRNDYEMANECKADGVHLNWSKSIVEDVRKARQTLATDMMIGADAGKSRHDAMQLGEAGVDYVAFGLPDFVRDRDTARARQRQLVAWWAEIFEIPCVASDVDEVADAADMVAVGADFIAITLPPLSANSKSLQTWLEAHTALLTDTGA